MKKGWFITFISDWFTPILKEESGIWGPYKTKRRAEEAYSVAKYSMGYKNVSEPFQRTLLPGEEARD